MFNVSSALNICARSLSLMTQVRTTMNKRFKRYGTLLITIMALALSGPANARDYLIEIVLFETLAGEGSTAGGLYYPKLGSTLRLNSESAIQAGFQTITEGLTLTDNAASIANSSRYRVIKHFAWRQPGLDEKSAVPILISMDKTLSIYLPEDIKPYDNFIPASAEATPDRPRMINTTTVNGSIKVRLGRFLHMEVSLVFTDGETQQSFRLSQSRKMRSRELHYIDNPRFGLLTRILPLEDTQRSAADSQTAPAVQ